MKAFLGFAIAVIAAAGLLFWTSADTAQEAAPVSPSQTSSSAATAKVEATEVATVPVARVADSSARPVVEPAAMDAAARQQWQNDALAAQRALFQAMSAGDEDRARELIKRMSAGSR